MARAGVPSGPPAPASRRLPTFFDDVFGKDLFDWNLSNFSNSGSTLPAVNVKETPEHFQVEMAAPGMSKENVEVTLDGNMLTISGKQQSEEEDSDEDNRYSRREFSYQSFQRRFTLPKDVVDTNQIQASYENGLLKLVIPKRDEAKQKPPRTIQIS